MGKFEYIGENGMTQVLRCDECIVVMDYNLLTEQWDSEIYVPLKGDHKLHELCASALKELHSKQYHR